jgi:hypothetical protein
MRSIKGSVTGLVLASILAMMPAAAFARGGGGGGGRGFGGGGGGRAFAGGGHAFGGFSGRGFSPGFRGPRGFSSGRGDHGRFGEALAASLPITARAAGGHGMGGPIGGGPRFSAAHGRDFAFHDGRFHNRFFAHDRFFRHHRDFVSNFAFVGFGFPDWYPNYYGSYPEDYSNNDGEPGYDDQYLDESSVPTQSELARRANSTGSSEGISSFGRPRPMDSSNDGSRYRSTRAEGRDMNVVREPNESTAGKADPVKLVTPAPNTQGGAFANLILVGWLNDAGNYVIFVQNTETKKLQKVTSEPNEDHFRIIEIRPNADPKLVQAVISNGTDQGTVKVAEGD